MREPIITYGYSKDHRPDLKQLLLILTTAADGGVPVQFRVADGNANDSVTQIESWDTLRGGRTRRFPLRRAAPSSAALQPR